MHKVFTIIFFVKCHIQKYHTFSCMIKQNQKLKQQASTQNSLTWEARCWRKNSLLPQQWNRESYLDLSHRHHLRKCKQGLFASPSSTLHTGHFHWSTRHKMENPSEVREALGMGYYTGDRWQEECVCVCEVWSKSVAWQTGIHDAKEIFGRKKWECQRRRQCKNCSTVYHSLYCPHVYCLLFSYESVKLETKDHRCSFAKSSVRNVSGNTLAAMLTESCTRILS